MITEYEQRQVQFLSDTELYTQAVTFMHGVGNPLPMAQINGLLNVSRTRTYAVLTYFIERQLERTTWEPKDEYIREFYRLLMQKLKQLETSAASLLKVRMQASSPEDKQELTMLLAREFIQHVLAENVYLAEVKSWQQAESVNPGKGSHPQRNHESNRANQRRP